MKFILAFLICIMASFSLSAQHRYYLATKGERVEYDTAVVMQISAYRNDLQILRRKDFIIDSLQNINQEYAKKIQATILENQQKEEAIDKYNTDLNENPALPEQEKNKWYMNPVLGMGVGILIGVYLIQ